MLALPQMDNYKVRCTKVKGQDEESLAKSLEGLGPVLDSVMD